MRLADILSGCGLRIRSWKAGRFCPASICPSIHLSFIDFMRARLAAWAKRVKQDTVMLWFARRHPATPLLAKLICVLAVAYALSPIDLIPDFIPILGFLDELVLLPAMIWLAVRLLPDQVVLDSRELASAWLGAQKAKPRSYIGAVLIVLVWLLAAYWVWRWLW